METNNNTENVAVIAAAVAPKKQQTKKVAKAKNVAGKANSVAKTIRKAKNDENQVVIKFNQYNEKLTHSQHEGAGRPGMKWAKIIPRATFKKATDVEIAEGLKKTRWAKHVSPNNLNVRINGIRRKLASETAQDYTCNHKFGRARKVLVEA